VPAGTAQHYGPLEASPLFDHLRFDVTVAGAPYVTRDFDLDADTINGGRLSFAILAPSGKPAVLRARLFRYGDTQGTEPRPETTIDASFAIETIPAQGVFERTIFLGTDDVGTVQGTPVPLPMAAGRPPAFHARTWPRGARVDCPASPRSGEVCIPGGAFWFGSPMEARMLPGAGAERLVVVSPYYLGANEVTVADFRKSRLPVTPWTGGHGGPVDDACRFTAAPGDYENLPVNCVDEIVARQYCIRMGADLPTEAQYEYAAGALRSAPFVWGSDPPRCGDVVMCQKSDYSSIEGDDSCKQPGAPGGPLPIGSGALDLLELPTGTVVDLIGNVSEFARDAWNRFTEPCWSRPGLYVDPVCTTPSKLDPPPIYSVRGGEWEQSPLRASGRSYAIGPTPFTGFRCARAAN
jgi:formylglycine-generating enzyme required for sulfatase activity